MPNESAGSAAVPPKLSLNMVAGPCADAQLASAGFNLTVGRTKASKLHIKDSSGVRGTQCQQARTSAIVTG